MAYALNNHTYKVERRYRRAMEDDSDMMIDNTHSFSDPYQHEYRTHPRPPRSSRRQRCSEYITWPQPVNVDYIVPDRRSRRQREHTSRPYAADYIDRPHEREDDHISPAPYNGSTSTSTNTYIDLNGDVYGDHHAGVYNAPGFSQPIHSKETIHLRHTSMPSFSTPYSSQPTHSSYPNRNDTPKTHKPHKSSTHKTVKSRRKSSSPPHRTQSHSHSPESSPPSDFQSFSSPTYTPSRAPESEYGSDFEPLFSAPRTSSRKARRTVSSEKEGISRSSSSLSSDLSSASESEVTSDHSGGFRFSQPQRSSYSGRSRNHQKGYRVAEDSDDESASGLSKEEFGSDVDFEIHGEGSWESRSSIERSDYVADSIDESESETGSEDSDLSSGEDSDGDSEDDSSSEYMMR